MLERTEGECIDCKTIILGFIYLISMLRFLRIANKRRVWLTERIQIWDAYTLHYRLASTSSKGDKARKCIKNWYV